MIESNYLKGLVDKAKRNIKTIVLPEGDDLRILEAAHIVNQEKAAKIIILGDEAQIQKDFSAFELNIKFYKLQKNERSRR